MTDAQILSIRSRDELAALWPYFNEKQRAVAAKHGKTLVIEEGRK